MNAASASFCNVCGAAMRTSAVTPSTVPADSPSGWDLATAGIDQRPEPADSRRLRKDECASWGARLGAAILDGILVLLAFGAVAGVAALVWYAVSGQSFDTFMTEVDRDEPGFDEADWFATLLFGGYFLGSVLWEVLWTSSPGMGKPGQRAAGFRVAVSDGVQRMGKMRALGRCLAKTMLGVAGLLSLLANAFTIGLSDRRQALHDMIAGTVCVKKEALRQRGIGPDAVASGHQAGMAPASAAAGPIAAPDAPSTSTISSTDGDSRSGPFM